MNLRKTQIKLHNELAEVGHLQLNQNECAENLRDGQSSVSMQLSGIMQGIQALVADRQTKSMTNVMTSNQSLDSGKLEEVLSSLSQLRLAQRHDHNIGICQASNTDMLTRVVRAQLRDLVIPLMEQRFMKYHADTDRKLDDVRQSMDTLSGEVGNVLNATQVQPLDALDQGGQAQSSDFQVHRRRISANTSFDPYGEIKMPTRNQDKWRNRSNSYQWRLRLPVGAVWVVVAVRTKTKGRSVAQAYKVVTQPFLRRIRITIRFVPSGCLNWMKGFTMLYRIKQDQTSIYPELCPGISMFNTIPKDAEVWSYARENDVDGLRRLFAKRLSSPHNRDSQGRTPLHVS